MAKKKPLTDNQIADLLLSELQDGIHFADTTLSGERSRALQYYYGDQPARLHKGSSGYRSLDVYDQVETARAMLLETFVGNELPLKIVPGRNKVAAAVYAAMATQYVNNVLFVDNPGEALLDQVIFDALVARIGVVRVDWVEETKVERFVLPPSPLEVINDLAEEEEVKEVVVEDAGDDLWEATVLREITDERIQISPVRPEDFVVNTGARDAYEYPIGHRLTKRMSQWKSEGFSEKDLKQALSDSERDQFEEAQVRNDAGWNSQSSSIADTDPLVTLYDVYATLDIEQDGNPRYYHVLLGANKVFMKEMVSDHPFVFYVPIKVPHVFHGVQFTKTIIPTANAKTALTRSVIDHAMRTNNPRYTVLRGTFKSPRELLENKYGGIVNINKPDGIQPLPQAGLNPFVFEVLKLLDTDLSDTTGISRLTQGVDKDVISKQNSRGMMQDLAQASETRLRVMARRFASGFLKELAKKIYSLAVANDAEGVPCVVDGKPVTAVPAQWPPVADIQVSLELSPAQKDAKIQAIGSTVGLIMQDPELAQGFDYQYKRRLAVQVLKYQGFADAELALDPEPPQPDPAAEHLKALELESRAAEVQIQKMNSQAAMMKAETERMKALQTLDLQAQKVVLDQWKARAEFSLEERKQAFNEAAAIYEKEIIRQKMEQDPESVKAIAAIDS